MKKLATVLMLLLCWRPALPDARTELNVTATIPPKPCDVGEPCKPTGQPLTASSTRVIVRADRISYVGSRPAVDVIGGVRIVLF